MRRHTAWLGVLLAVLPAAAGAAPPTERFRASVRGAVSIAGNTLGLSKAVNQNGPGSSDGIGTFTTTNEALVDDFPINPANPWFPGTTASYALNSSSARLALPPGGDVLYAELVWAGSYQYGAENVEGALNSPIALTSESGATLGVSPDPATATTINEGGSILYRYYVRSADVTAFVHAHGEGMYTVAGVPATQDTNINNLQAAGWALVVAYADPGAPRRTLGIVVDGRVVDPDRTAEVAFPAATPPTGAVAGRLLVAALEGDANRPGDRVLVAPGGGAAFVPVSGVNNPVGNFFASQINDPFGVLDTTGTFGSRNHDAAGGADVLGGRQGWDVTGIPLSALRHEIANGQTTALVRIETTGDELVVAALAFESTAEDTPPVCGNGVVEEGERCDDGNLIDGDGCESTCQPTPPPGFCGDGFLDPGEECDAGAHAGFPLCACEADCRRPSPGTACGVINQYRTLLAVCEADPRMHDEDADAEPDPTDHCPGTPAGDPTDEAGCSQAQFCAGFDVADVRGALACRFADWKNDEPLMPLTANDCRVARSTAAAHALVCVPER